MSMLNRESTLALNADWLPVSFKNGQDAICTMMSGDKDNPPALGISLDYEIMENGTVNFDNVTNLTMYKWEDWMKLPVRPHDFGVKTIRGDIRIPTVIIHPNFRKVIRKKKRFTKVNVFERDGWTCQYTGMKLTRATATIDHILPRAKGGKTTWENCTAAHISVNNKKGDKTNDEAGLKLLKKPVEPEGGLLYQDLVNKYSIRHHDWDYFLKAFDKD
jgi:hypothetical protein